MFYTFINLATIPLIKKHKENPNTDLGNTICYSNKHSRVNQVLSKACSKTEEITQQLIPSKNKPCWGGWESMAGEIILYHSILSC